MKLEEYLKYNEGCRLRSYLDTEGVWTIGFGQTGPKIVEGMTITLAEAEAMLERSANLARDAAMRVIGLETWSKLSEPRRLVLCDMAYQMGEGGLAAFVRTLKAIREGRYSDAAIFMKQSLWAKQTPNRANRNITMMLTGEFFKP